MVPTIDAARGRALTVICFVTPVLGVVAPKGLAPFFALMALVALLLLWRAPGPLFPRGVMAFPALVFALLLASWAGFSPVWALQPVDATSGAARLLAMAIGGALLVRLALPAGFAPVTLLGPFAIAGYCLALAFTIFEYQTGGAFYGLTHSALMPVWEMDSFLDRAFCILTLGIWPILVALSRRRTAQLGLLGLTAGVVFFAANMATKLAFALGLLAMLAAFWRPGVSGRVLAGIVAATVLLAPVAVELLPSPGTVTGAPGTPESSLTHRLMVWHFASDRISERPVLGWGMDASRHVPGAFAEIRPGANYLPNHPHNGALQVWLELGAVGAVLLAAFLWYAVRGLARATPDGRVPGMLGFLASAFTIAGLSFGLWQGWWLATLVLMAVLALLVLGRSTPGREDGAADDPAAAWR